MLFRSSMIDELSIPTPFTHTAGAPSTPAPSSGPPAKPVAQGANPVDGDVFSEPLPSDSDQRMEKIWADYESVEPYLIMESTEELSNAEVKIDWLPSGGSSRPFQV